MANEVILKSDSWDKDGEKLYETGVEHGILFKARTTGTPEEKEANPYMPGIVWNGLTQVQETPSGAEANAQYADNIKYLNLYSAEEFGATVEAFTYPDAFGECDGSFSPCPGLTVGQQGRIAFGLAYETKVGNDVLGDKYGYKLHIIYNAMASPSEKAYQTINDSPEPITFSWELTTTPVTVGKVTISGVEKEIANTSLLVLDTTILGEEKVKAVRDVLWGKEASGGSEAVESRLPKPKEIIEMCLANG